MYCIMQHATLCCLYCYKIGVRVRVRLGLTADNIKYANDQINTNKQKRFTQTQVGPTE